MFCWLWRTPPLNRSFRREGGTYPPSYRVGVQPGLLSLDGSKSLWASLLVKVKLAMLRSHNIFADLRTQCQVRSR